MLGLPGVHLAVVGDGELRAELTDLAHATGLIDRVHFSGWWLDMPSALGDLDVVALSSRNEGTPVALIEALACGRPVVSTDVGGVRSVVEHGRTGLLVAPGDHFGLAAAIRETLDDRIAAAGRAAAGREHVRVMFGETRLVSEIRALYEALLAKRR
jgi:glycosyltransferase involved in cell wall biosynthesis